MKTRKARAQENYEKVALSELTSEITDPKRVKNEHQNVYVRMATRGGTTRDCLAPRLEELHRRAWNEREMGVDFSKRKMGNSKGLRTRSFGGKGMRSFLLFRITTPTGPLTGEIQTSADIKERTGLPTCFGTSWPCNTNLFPRSGANPPTGGFPKQKTYTAKLEPDDRPWNPRHTYSELGAQGPSNGSVHLWNTRSPHNPPLGFPLLRHPYFNSV
nr:hypothetical protein Iba_chr09aCG13210 [Ipomoea batatas]